MEKFKYGFQSIMFAIVLMIIFGVVVSFKKNETNKSSPKKATLVYEIIVGDIIYG